MYSILAVTFRLTPPRVVICPPPSPRLLNVCGVEQSDFRDSSTLCLWSLDPLWAEDEEEKISVEVTVVLDSVCDQKLMIIFIHRSIWEVTKHILRQQKGMQVERYF